MKVWRNDFRESNLNGGWSVVKDSFTWKCGEEFSQKMVLKF